MLTRFFSIEELKRIFIEAVINKTNKVTKVTNNSTLNGIGYGVSKVGQKALKEVALVESRLFPDFASGSDLDFVASTNGISARFGASESSTYIRLVGSSGTAYIAGTHTVTGSHGIVFDLDEDITLGDNGFGYVKVRSQSTGKVANVDGLSINTVSPVPAGHSYVVNEYEATGGRDAETDDIFRRRIKVGANIVASGTIGMITEVFRKINNNILKVYHRGRNTGGQTVLSVVTQNGVDLTPTELTDLQSRAQEYLTLSDSRPLGSNTPLVTIENNEFHEIDITFRVELKSGAVADDVRKSIQNKFSKYLDFRFWGENQKVEWDDLFVIVKQTEGVKYVSDRYFSPNQDITVEVGKLPRIRGFLMLDTDGNIISDNNDVLNPIYYPSDPSTSYQDTALASI